MSKTQNKITESYKKLDVSRISFTDLEANARSKNQRISYLRYRNGDSDSQLLFQTPIIELSTYGIPQKPKEDNASETYKRDHIKVPLELDKAESKALYDKLVELDTRVGEELKADLFKKNPKEADMYEYQPVARVPDEEVDEKGELKFRPPYFKAKLDIDYETKEVKTKVYLRTEEDGKVKRTLVEDIKTVDDLASVVRYRSKVRLILMPNKLWAANNKIGNAKKKAFGLGFKVMQIEVEPAKTVSMKDATKDDAFIDDDMEENNDNQNDQTTDTQQTEHQTDDNTDEHHDDTDQQQDEDDKQEVQQVKPQRGRAKKASASSKLN